ncbi:hypothetical protein LIER_12031 [Lithospermum erythrorhizon]|uniref:Small ribosomal subunit protein mS38 n=1 Tax=Lithospermum erythrorhizon TaxID=34254 RepID=A0AAV3PQ85_LITER
MATPLFKKLIKNQSRFESISRKITASHLTTTSAAAATNHPVPTTNPFQIHQLEKPIVQNSIFLDPCNSFGIYPSFSFEHFLNPVAPFAPEDNGVDLGKEDEESNMVYADSVKKKRKKKMNKHKLKKLRKRLRRKN